MIDFADKSSDAERSVIGSVLLLNNPDSQQLNWLFSFLKPEAFYSQFHQKIFSGMRELHTKRAPIDMVTLEKACEKFELENVFLFLAEVQKQTPSAANLKAYASIVRECSIERFAQSKLQDAIAMVTDETGGDIYQRLGLVESLVNDIQSRGLRNEHKGLRHIGDFGSSWLDEWEERIEQGEDTRKFTTGIESLDEALGVKGLRRGSLVAVGARPKMGKTALLVTMANHFGLVLNETVATFSLEMPGNEIFERSLCTESNLSAGVFYDQRGVTDETNGRAHDAMTKLVNSNLYIDDTPGISVSHIQREARKLHNKHPIGLLCVDYLTLMTADKADRNDLAYGNITKALKNLAKELNCVVLLLTQLNRGLESRPDKRPLPSDSKDTGQIEQDCDVWIGLYREAVYVDDAVSPELMELLIRLNRHGPSGTAFAQLQNGTVKSFGSDEGNRILAERHHEKSTSKQPFKFKKEGVV